MSLKLKLPESLMFPVEITRILVKSGDNVARRQPLLQYKYWNRAEDGIDEEGTPMYTTREFYASFESPYDGVVTAINVSTSDRINGADTCILEVEEACDHSVQYGGLCAKCGIDLEQKDYMGYSDTDRAPIAMSHGTQGLTVSRNEAEQLENASTKRLLAAKKLILIVDLDQTIIHAAIDSYIGQWINDKSNPNHESVKDVKSFMLREQRREGLVNCWYYIKLRPGLHEFLEKMSQIFELHIYTMATKAYALEIAKIVDPDGKYFGDRILGREESGSMVQKNLKRLFPVTTELVTVIDDRGDVWGWSSHLVRVVPYTFFDGTGDINSGLLPKRAGLVTPNEEQGPHKLTDEDTELQSLTTILTHIHEEFFKEYFQKKKVDIGVLLPQMKVPVFAGCVFLFSGIFPYGVSLENADIVQWVKSFGALVVAKFVDTVTHVIANTGSTMKTRQAAGYGIPVVRTNWLFACLKEWERAPIDEYKIHVPDPIQPEELNEEAVVEKEENDVDFAPTFVGGGVNWDDLNKELEEFTSDEETNGVEPHVNESEDSQSKASPNEEVENSPEHNRKVEVSSLKRSRSESDDESEQLSKKQGVETSQIPVEAEESDSDADLAAELAAEFQ